MVYITLLAMEYVTATIRLRMIIGSMLLVIVPLVAVSLIQASIVQNTVLDGIKKTRCYPLQIKQLFGLTPY